MFILDSILLKILYVVSTFIVSVIGLSGSKDINSYESDPEKYGYAAIVSTKVYRGAMVQVGPSPTHPEWDADIPAYYGEGSSCSREQATVIANKMWSVGASDETINWMLSMMSRESTCDSSAHNYNPRTGDDSWGLCQINVLGGHFGSRGILNGWDRYRFSSDFNYNVDACVKLWTVCGKGPWNYGDYFCRKPSDYNG